MKDRAIIASGVGKEYQLSAPQVARYNTLRDTLAGGFAKSLRRFRARNNGVDGHSRESRAFRALDDVSFEVKQGDVIGVIGRNGAGKSTLLKILARITDPTTGRIEVRGRMGSLLEVGTGFHPELTGRENIYLSGAILGMSRADIDRKFDEIVEFAEIEKFLSTPAKRYSSGMYMRLAFSVAAHLDPEILLVDEVLAVGDAAFQKKCLGRMTDVAKANRTILFVSHNMSAILNLCTRVIVLDRGRVLVDTDTRSGVARYLELLEGYTGQALSQRTDRKGNQRLKFTEFELRDAEGKRVDRVTCGQSVILAFKYVSDSASPLKSVHISVGIHGAYDEHLFHLATDTAQEDFPELPPAGEVTCNVPQLPLQPGSYPFNVFSRVGLEIADWIQHAGSLEVEAGDFFSSGRLPPPGQGSFLVAHSWSSLC